MIKIDNLVIGYERCNIGPSISGHIKKGSMIAVVGPNGIGKSTFLKTLAGLLPPSSGKLEFTKKKELSISYLPQKKNMNCHFPITVFDVVSMGCWPKVNFFKKLNHHQKYLIWAALEEVKLLNLLNQCINSLSGGQFQRMLFARILVQQSSLILLDEPFQDIDQITCTMLMYAIKKLHRHGCTVIAVLHDNEFVSKYFSNILVLNKSSSIWIKSK